MNITLMGYGKMGREIEKIAISRGHTIASRITSKNAGTVTAEELRKADVVIEFSTPHTVLSNLTKCFNAHVPVVVGTTGWYDSFEKVKAECDKAGSALFHATNFSPGVNLFFKVNEYLASLMNGYPEYDVSMEEIHHIHKLDKPSGTAITIASQVIDNLRRKKKWSITEKGPDILHITDRREGEVPGTHTVKYSSGIDDIEITHRAHNRRGFALGAVLAAEFLKGRKGIFTMKDLI